MSSNLVSTKDEFDEAEDLRVWPLIHFMDQCHLVLYKPAGIYVHPPENPRFRRGLKRHTCTQWLNDEKNLKAFPAHRVDYATEGILLFGLTKETTRHLNQQFLDKSVQKKYYAVVRGWMPEMTGSITLPLELDSTGESVPCETRFQVLKEIELPFQVSKKFSTSRYSLILCEPVTGRWHQIRRHMNRVSHPILGDREHGDSHHNRFFRDQLKIGGLCLLASEISYLHPQTNQRVVHVSPRSEKWDLIQTLFDYQLPALIRPSAISDNR